MSEFAKWFRETRLDKELTLREIMVRSESDSLTIGRLSDIEHSRETPTPTEVGQICLVLVGGKS